jgi:hypothetical protein
LEDCEVGLLIAPLLLLAIRTIATITIRATKTIPTINKIRLKSVPPIFGKNGELTSYVILTSFELKSEKLLSKCKVYAPAESAVKENDASAYAERTRKRLPLL